MSHQFLGLSLNLEKLPPRLFFYGTCNIGKNSPQTRLWVYSFQTSILYTNHVLLVTWLANWHKRPSGHCRWKGLPGDSLSLWWLSTIDLLMHNELHHNGWESWWDRTITQCELLVPKVCLHVTVFSNWNLWSCFFRKRIVNNFIEA